MGVVDILPGCVSSVYFMYNPKWEKYSLGKVCTSRGAKERIDLHVLVRSVLFEKRRSRRRFMM